MNSTLCRRGNLRGNFNRRLDSVGREVQVANRVHDKVVMFLSNVNMASY